MSHSPLLNLPGPSRDLLDDIEDAIADARRFVDDYDPELVVIFSPDHYNGFFYKMMPPFCIGTSANGVGDYGTHAGPLDVPEKLATECAKAVLDAGVDVAVSACMEVDHGTVQPLEKLFGEATSRPVIPIFINAIGVPLGPLHRCRALGTAVGAYLATLDKRILVLGSGGLSHSPPVPTLATAPPPVLERIVHGRPMTPEQRQARQEAVIDAAKSFAAGESGLQPLNPVWDQRFLEIIDGGWLDRTRPVVELIRGTRGRQLRPGNQNLGRRIRRAGECGALRNHRALLQTGRRTDRRLRHQNGGAEMTTALDDFDHVVDVLVVGSGGGGMTAALTAQAAGLDALVVEKSSFFGGSTALSGGGIWVPGAPAQRREGYVPSPEGVVEYLRQITDGLVSEARIRQYVESAPKMLGFLERLSGWCEFVWKPGYADYYPELTGGSELGSTINVPPIDLRKLGPDEQQLLQPLALAPRGIWLGPKELRTFYRIRQSWAGKAVLLKLISRMVRARVFGERMAAIGQSLAARLRLTMRERGVPLWLDSPMTELLTGADGSVTGVSVERVGETQRIGARLGVILASGGFDHDLAWRKELLPVVDHDWSFGNPAATGDGIRAAQKLGAATELLDEAWWFPAIQWPDGRMQFMLNERMMPAQFIVNGDGKRFINEAAPYMDFGHAMIDGQKSGVTHIPCWLITDHRSWKRYVVGGHLPIPKIPGAPVPTGRKVPSAWLESGVVKAAMTWGEMATRIGVPAENLSETAEPLQRTRPQGSRRRLQPRRQRLRQLLRRSDAAQPEPVSAGRPAVLRIPDRPRRPRDVGWPADRRIRAGTTRRRHRGAATVRGG